MPEQLFTTVSDQNIIMIPGRKIPFYCGMTHKALEKVGYRWTICIWFKS